MNRVGNERLLKLADYLENQAKDERFDLSLIAETNEQCEFPSKTACGTAACAIGHMPQVFPKHCKYQVPFWEDGYREDHRISLEVVGKGKLDNKSDFSLAEEFFNITSEQADYLFQPDSYGERKGRKTVAKRIRMLVRDNGEMNSKTYLGDSYW